MINRILSFFEVRERNSMLSVEIVAGITTFMTMSYIIFLQPNILAGLMPGAQPTGMDKEALLVTTCIAAAFGSILMGILANYPLALAPGMGENFFFVSLVAYALRPQSGSKGRKPGRQLLPQYSFPASYS